MAYQTGRTLEHLLNEHQRAQKLLEINTSSDAQHAIQRYHHMIIVDHQQELQEMLFRVLANQNEWTSNEQGYWFIASSVYLPDNNVASS